MPEFDWTKGVKATAIATTSGVFHPAVKNGDTVWYWPNITMGSDGDAAKRAQDSLSDALTEANWHISSWNMYKW